MNISAIASTEAPQERPASGLLGMAERGRIPDALLRKPAPLTEEERAEMETHPEVGARFVGLWNSGVGSASLTGASVINARRSSAVGRAEGRGGSVG